MLPLAPDVGLIHFHNAGHPRRVNFLHCGPDSVAKIPGSLVRHAKGALHLVGAHALLGFDHQVDSHEPLGKAKVTVVEDRAGSNRELIAASPTIVLEAGV